LSLGCLQTQRGTATTARRPRAPEQMAAVPRPSPLPGDPPPAAPGAAGEGWGTQQDGRPRLPPGPRGRASPGSRWCPPAGLGDAEPQRLRAGVFKPRRALSWPGRGQPQPAPGAMAAPWPGHRRRSPETDPNAGCCSPGPRRGLLAGPALPGVPAGLVPSSVPSRVTKSCSELWGDDRGWDGPTRPGCEPLVTPGVSPAVAGNGEEQRPRAA